MAGEGNNATVEETDSARACSVVNYLEVARILQAKLHNLGTSVGEASELRMILESAAEEFGVPGDDHGSSCSGPTANKRTRMPQSVDAVGEEATCTCRHVCAEHEELMNPNLWERLPRDVLQIVFARLPLPDISRLHCLSRAWRMTMATLDSEDNALHSDFFTVCGEAYPRLFAFIKPFGSARVAFKITVFDVKSNKWHTSRIVLGHGQVMETTSASDGGLVCFISSLVTLTKQERRLRESLGVREWRTPYFHVIIVNPLTRSWKELPRFQNDPVAVHMVQIKVDRQTKGFKVLVVGDWRGVEGVTMQRAQLYDSQTERWIRAEGLPDLFLGFKYDWGDFDGSGRREGPCAFDCAEGRLIKLYGDNKPYAEGCLIQLYDDDSPCDGRFVRSYALDKDTLFVLRVGGVPRTGRFVKRPVVYYIVEYRFQVQAKVWERVRTHNCSHFATHNYGFQLFACNGFLMMFASTRCKDDSSKWIYDLATGKWSDLPEPPNNCWMGGSADVCELQFNIHPGAFKLMDAPHFSGSANRSPSLPSQLVT